MLVYLSTSALEMYIFHLYLVNQILPSLRSLAECIFAHEWCFIVYAIAENIFVEYLSIGYYNFAV